MATNVTFTTLLDDLGAYLERARMPGTTAFDQRARIINLSERSIMQELNLQGYERTLRSNMEAGKAIYNKPARFRETISMHVVINNEMQALFPRSYEYCRMFWPNTEMRDYPKFYADHGDQHWLIAATPGNDLYWETKIYQMPVLLDEDNQTNWMTDFNPVALQWRCLKEMAIFLRKFDEAARFEAEYGKAIGAVAERDNKKLMDRAAERDGV